MDAATLAAAMDRFQVVDVRYPNEWEAGHIDGAVHIPVDYVYERVGELDARRPVVTVCLSGIRSAEAAEDLAGHGFEVESLEGGMGAWVAHGLAIVASDGGAGRIADPEPPTDDRPPEMRQFQNDFMERPSRCGTTSVTGSPPRKRSWPSFTGATPTAPPLSRTVRRRRFRLALSPKPTVEPRESKCQFWIFWAVSPGASYESWSAWPSL